MNKIKTITVKANVNIEAIPLTANLVARVVRNTIMLNYTVEHLVDEFTGDDNGHSVWLSREEIDSIVNAVTLLRDIEKSFIEDDNTEDNNEEA